MPHPTDAAAVATPLASILVVDDDADFLHTVCEVLEEEGYRVERASNGRAALDRLLAGPLPDLVLTDLVMPALDGWQLVTALKEHPELAGIPVVVMSGGHRALTSAPVSAGYVDKPINPARLLETLAAALARKDRRVSGVLPRTPG